MVAIIFGLPVLYTALYHPVSRMMSEAPLYKELSKNSFMVMSSKMDLATGRLIRYTDASGKDQISRIVGMADDEIRFEDHLLYVNDSVVETYNYSSLPNSKLIVPKDSVVCFPDYFPEGSGYSAASSLGFFVVPVNAITGTILYSFDNGTAVEKHPLIFVYGAVLMMLYFFVFLAMGKYKEFIFKPVYYPTRIAVGFNLIIWGLIGLYGMYVGLWAAVPAIYYVFISWLTFLGLSISEASFSILMIAVFGVLAVISDVTISARGVNIER